MTAAAGDGLWRVDMDALGEADWATQWTMTDEEWRSVRKNATETADSPSSALDRFEDAGLRRVSPDVAAGMLRVVAEKARASRADREALSGTRRDARFAHLLGTCVAAARRGSDALAPGSVADAAWALAAVAGERANAAEMEVLADRAAATADEMTPRQLANLAWALATCRHASAAYFRAMDVRFAGDDGCDVPLVLVGPVAVDPERQQGGIGRALVAASLAAADARGDALMLIGDPEYYGRFFGFSAEATAGSAAEL